MARRAFLTLILLCTALVGDCLPESSWVGRGAHRSDSLQGWSRRLHPDARNLSLRGGGAKLAVRIPKHLPSSLRTVMSAISWGFARARSLCRQVTPHGPCEHDDSWVSLGDTARREASRWSLLLRGEAAECRPRGRVGCSWMCRGRIHFPCILGMDRGFLRNFV
jgi:hypothetical protein